MIVHDRVRDTIIIGRRLSSLLGGPPDERMNDYVVWLRLKGLVDIGEPMIPDAAFEQENIGRFISERKYRSADTGSAA